jgi:hypothetical protein
VSLVIHAIAQAPFADPPAGLGGAPLRWISAGRLGLWATEASAEGLDREQAFDHHRVVEAIAARSACLPMRFGQRAADERSAAALLGVREAELLDLLERVGGKREIAVTLLWAGALPQEGRGHAAASAATTPGRRFLDGRRAAFAADAGRRAVAEALAQRLHVGLALDQANVRHSLCPSGDVAVSSSLLVQRADAERLKEEAVRVSATLDGVRAVVSGPWPPYTFAQ